MTVRRERGPGYCRLLQACANEGATQRVKAVIDELWFVGGVRYNSPRPATMLPEWMVSNPPPMCLVAIGVRYPSRRLHGVHGINPDPMVTTWQTYSASARAHSISNTAAAFIAVYPCGYGAPKNCMASAFALPVCFKLPPSTSAPAAMAGAIQARTLLPLACTATPIDIGPSTRVRLRLSGNMCSDELGLEGGMASEFKNKKRGQSPYIREHSS